MVSKIKYAVKTNELLSVNKRHRNFKNSCTKTYLLLLYDRFTVSCKAGMEME